MDRVFLQQRLAETPLAEPTDAVKLAYQSAFGCGHLLLDEAACLKLLQRERAATPVCAAVSPAVPLGGGLCRLNLASPLVAALPERRLLAMMKLTEQRVTARANNGAAFRESLALLEQLTRAGAAPFSSRELEEYLRDYRAKGCPPVSHSPRYREAYHPAYRVVLHDFALLLPLLAEIEGRLGRDGTAMAAGCLPNNGPVAATEERLSGDGGMAATEERLSSDGKITATEEHLPGDGPVTATEERLPGNASPWVSSFPVVLDGCCGAGKTTLAGLLAALFRAPVIAMDDFFLPPDMRTPARLAQPGGNLHYERFQAQVLPRLAWSEAFSYQRYDCATGEFHRTDCPAAPLRVVEGSYALHPRFRAAYREMNALTAFVTVNSGEQLRRLQARNPERYDRFLREWIPMENAYFAATGAREWAQIRLESVPHTR